MKRHAQQINGREGETATLLSRSLLNSNLRGGGFAPRHLNRCAAFSCLRMKRFIILTLLLLACSACAVQESSTFVAAQTDSNFNAVQIKTNAVIAQESDKFRAIVPNAFWEKIFFESINERVSSSKLSNLRSKGLPKDDLEIRIWSGFGLSRLQGFVLKRTAGEWSAVDLDWEISENPKGKRNVKQVDKKIDVPKSGWDAAWQRLVEARILTLPDAEEINCSGGATDGMSYVVEYNLKNTYRTYMYDNPNYAKCNEAKQMIEITKIIAEEFYKREGKVDR